MKKMLIGAAAGALGALGTAGLMTAAPASAQCNMATTPPLERAACLVNADVAGFLESANPVNQIDTFLNGSPDDSDFGSLGILQQPTTFVNSLVGEGGFFSGPISSLPQPEAPETP
jgi:hypothetical protein